MGKFPNDARSQAIMVWQERGRRAESFKGTAQHGGFSASAQYAGSLSTFPWHCAAWYPEALLGLFPVVQEYSTVFFFVGIGIGKELSGQPLIFKGCKEMQCWEHAP